LVALAAKERKNRKKRAIGFQLRMDTNEHELIFRETREKCEKIVRIKHLEFFLRPGGTSGQLAGKDAYATKKEAPVCTGACKKGSDYYG
jgi:hypothetical protein